MSVGPIIPPAGGIGAAAPSAASGGQSPPAAPPGAGAPATAQAPVNVALSAVDAALLGALPTQDSLGPLLADLGAAVDSPALPPDARATAQQILSLQAPLDASVTSADLRAAVSGTGLFLETLLAAQALAPGAGAGQAPDLNNDLKALLSRLAEALSPQALSAAMEIEAAELPPAPGAPKRTTNFGRGSVDRPPPPSAGGPTAAQPAARSSLEPQTDTAHLGQALRHDAEAALARLQLSQIASLPKPGAPTRWSFELPVAAPDGRAMAQFEISRDGRGNGAAGAPAEPTWRAKFSINVEPNGPVHAEVALSGGRTRVTLWGERPATQAALTLAQGQLAQDLVGDQGADAAVRVLGGAPAPPQVEAGRLINRTS